MTDEIIYTDINSNEYLSESKFRNFWKNFLSDNKKLNESIQIYVHYPWCRKVCSFCVFGTCQQNRYNDIITKYEDRTVMMLSELDNILLELNKVPNIMYFGGGTASLWTLKSLEKIRNDMALYKSITHTTMEIHPFDLSDELIDFYANTMKFRRVSIGVQSFNKEAIVNQGRIFVDVDKISSAVEKFKNAGVFVNIDLVSHFDGDNSFGIFKDDFNIATTYVKPDSIYISPNYKSDNYYRNSIMLRNFLKNTDIVDYVKDDITSLSIDINDIINYHEKPYTLIHRKWIDNYSMEDVDMENMIGVGGFGSSTAVSRTTNDDLIASYYDPVSNEFKFIHRISPIKTKYFDKYGNAKDIHIGHYVIDVKDQLNNFNNEEVSK